MMECRCQIGESSGNISSLDPAREPLSICHRGLTSKMAHADLDGKDWKDIDGVSKPLQVQSKSVPAPRPFTKGLSVHEIVSDS